ncbi:hypothetical protein PR003_g25344 [Phytophthora rubi]|uniref:Uncharacterized protein n=1 Tax=Phytophthora rubi TaxID=129364 RepID=A0A6A3I824_9STRA|nr:hypothetical protein PR002_g25314 [Phytophthora rubi]KAE8976916.1 hypothetical protein PR001_g25277 [Phytophthora rubi]KAE9290249.1 hypothetical protein PR003_g25344 [Phytophthora rubi]
MRHRWAFDCDLTVKKTLTSADSHVLSSGSDLNVSKRKRNDSYAASRVPKGWLSGDKSTTADLEPSDIPLRLAKERIAEVEGLLSEARALSKEAEVGRATAANAVTSIAEWGLLSIDDDLLDEVLAEHLRLRFLAALADLVREEGYHITAVNDRGDTSPTGFGDEDDATQRRSE